MKNNSLSPILNSTNRRLNNSLSRLSVLLEQLMSQAKHIDQFNTQHKSHWLIENNDLFSREVFKSQSDRFAPYVEEATQRLTDLSRLMLSTSANNEKIAMESLIQIEQQISALMNALQSNQSMHQTAQMVFDIKRKVPIKSEEQNVTQNNPKYENFTKAVLLSSHQLYQKLNEHNEFERRLMDMVQTRQQQLAQCKSQNQNTKLSQEVLALHQRLGRCRKAISSIERDIELTEKR